MAGAMKHKVSDLEGALLDAAVAKAEGLPVHPGPGDFIVADTIDTVYAHERAFSRSWPDGGPIVQREGIELRNEWRTDPDSDVSAIIWRASCRSSKRWEASTPLIAAMRAYCASKFGEEVELP